MIIKEIKENLRMTPFTIACDSRDGHQGRTLMIDDTPYIIVDNQKISPIERSSPADSTTTDRNRGKEPTFGIADRVTISSEAREKARQYRFGAETDIRFSECPSPKRSPLRQQLTYTPK